MSACTNAPAPTTIPLPADSIGVAEVAPGYAVLSGNASQRTVTLVSRDGKVLLNFGVTKEATDIAAAYPDGPLFISIARTETKNVSGSIERWTLDGTNTGRIAASGPVEALQLSGSRLYGLVSTNNAKALTTFDIDAMTVRTSAALARETRKVALCPAGSPTSEVTIEKNETAYAHAAETYARFSTSIATNVKSAICSARAIRLLEEPRPGVRLVTILTLTGQRTERSLPASAHAIRLTMPAVDDGGFAILSSSEKTSTLERLDR